jgi:polygalacturonase
MADGDWRAPSMRFSSPIFIALCAIVFGCLPGFGSGGAYAATEPIAPIHAPFEMPQLERPVFPDRVTSIVSHGAVEGGTVKNTAAIAAAIRVVAEAGGGRVLIPAGRWLTGPIHLRSNIELHLERGATLVFSDAFEDYLPVVLVRAGGIELYNYSPLIYARDCENIAVTGPGSLDGNGRAWWEWAKRETRRGFEMGAAGTPVEKRIFGTPDDAIRPSFIQFFECRNVLLEDFTIGSGPNWTIHPVYCENIIIRRVNVDTSGPNNDGIDPDSCRNMLVEYCTFSTGDDCVVLKSGYNEDGRRVGRPTENFVMRHCSSRRGHGGLVIGSEMSGSVRNVYMHDCDFEGTDRVLRIKSRPGRGGVVENVWVSDVTARALKKEAVVLNMDYSSDTSPVGQSHLPRFRNIHVKNLAVSGAPLGVRIVGLKDSMIEDVSFTNMAIVADSGVDMQFVRGVVFDRVAITGAKLPLWRVENASGVIVDGRPYAP